MTQDESSRASRIVTSDEYGVLARIYYRVMSHVDYRLWTNFCVEIFTDHGLPSVRRKPPVKLLECACGTGQIAIELAKRGFGVVGFDKSPQMISVATDSCKNMPGSPIFHVAEFSDFEFPPAFDASFCLYDSVNYILELSALTSFLQRVYIALTRRGLFLFDVCTEYNSRLYFNGRQEEGRGDGFSYRRSMTYDHADRIQRNRFDIVYFKEPHIVHREVHRQRVYRLSEIRTAICDAGFDILEETNEFDRFPPRFDALRVHFICGK